MTKAMCENCSKLKLQTPGQRKWMRFVVFNVNFEQILRIVLVFSSLTLNIIVNFEHISQLVLVFLLLTLNM